VGRHRSDPLGLARIAIAVLAVVLALGLLIVGGIALWGALTSDTAKPSSSPSANANNNPPASKPQTTSQAQPNPLASTTALIIKCLAAQCKVYVGGPGPTDVQFNGELSQGTTRFFDEPHLSLVVDDASTVQITINGKVQPAGPHSQQTYEITKKD
jgi:hypothetical protein